jgi:hypothetical protein
LDERSEHPNMHRHAVLRAMPSIVVKSLPGKGRGVVALEDMPPGSKLLECTPLAHVLKTADGARCLECLAPSSSQHCSSSCAETYVARGGEMLNRVDLSGLQALHEEQGRKFPLLIASLLASLLAEMKYKGRLPDAWAPLSLCWAELHPEAASQVENEHAILLNSFSAAGLANLPTLELFLPLARYRQLLGAAQLNSFELTLLDGARVSALLPGLASCFNHSCEPNVLMACGETSLTTFVAGEAIAAGDELCISYVDLELDFGERHELLLHKYGFACQCSRCACEKERLGHS